MLAQRDAAITLRIVERAAPEAESVSIVLIHGGSITSRCWDRVAPLVERPVLAVDLPGRPGCPADHRTITIESGAVSVLRAMDEAGIERATLVGHSFSGVTLVKLAELAPERIEQLVFIACVVPPEGKRIVDVLLPHHAARVEQILDTGGVTIPLQARSGGHDLDASREADAGRGPGRDSVSEPALPYGEAVSLAGLDNGVPCRFVLLERDTAQTPELQARTIATIRRRCACEVVRLDAGHMAMYSHPQELADAAGIGRRSGKRRPISGTKGLRIT